MPVPLFVDDPAFKALRAGDLDGFHRLIQDREVVDFSDADLRATDFRKVDLSKLVLRNAYLRDADFRGCDLRHIDLEGASVHNARIAGVYFQKNLPSREIRMSLRHGTRMRTDEK